MTALDLITAEIPALDAQDSALLAMQWMDEYKVKHLPVVDNGEFIGLVSDSMVLDMENPEQPLKALSLKLQKIYVLEEQHLYDVIKLFADFQLSALAVCNDKEMYHGVISIYHLVHSLSKMVAVQERGSVVVLEINTNDFSMSEISQIVEGNDVRILSMYITPHEDSTRMEVTLKLNRGNINGVLQTFMRYDYTVSASFQENRFNDFLLDRYDELMRYLNM